MLVARAMPVAPFVVVSYAAGLSGVRLGPYVMGTAVGLVPWSVLYVSIGASAARIDSWAPLIPLVSGAVVVMSIALLTGLSWRRRQRRGNEPDSGPGSTTAAALD
ncbi:SNARE associated Golgi protein [Blastococcus sp. DSM 46786]|nr:SNARE associated Golgi protein [Blastococcus sp. DSM 46786]